MARTPWPALVNSRRRDDRRGVDTEPLPGVVPEFVFGHLEYAGLVDRGDDPRALSQLAFELARPPTGIAQEEAHRRRGVLRHGPKRVERAGEVEILREARSLGCAGQHIGVGNHPTRIGLDRPAPMDNLLAFATPIDAQALAELGGADFGRSVEHHSDRPLFVVINQQHYRPMKIRI